MASTNIRGAQVLDGTIARADLNTSTVGQAVVTKIVQGSNISLSSTGADSGTGDVTVAATNQPPSADAGNLITTGSDSLHYLGASQIQPTIWSSRLRTWNAVGNPSFEVDQINVGNTVANANAKVIDRWSVLKSGTLVVSAAQFALTAPDAVVPGTNFRISRSALRVTVTTAQASLAATDYLIIQQQVEGPLWRELQGDVHSASLLVRSSVGSLAFGLALRDPATATKSLTKLCTGGAANTWSLVTLPNLPAFPAGNFTVASGSVGYQFTITLAAGSTNTNVANDSWQGGNTFGAVGQSNFAANASATFDLAFIQHEPGPLCTTLIDCSFGVNLDGPMGCTRYFQKSYPYGVAPGSASSIGYCSAFLPATQSPVVPIRFPKIMAKTPTITGYSYSSGAVNTVRDATAGADKAISAALIPADSGFAGFTVTSPNAAIWQYGFHYTADTGW